MRTLLIFWSAFFDLCWLRLRPQDIPNSSLLLILTLVTYTLAGSISSALQLPLPEAILSGLVETLLLIILTGSLLYLTGHSTRLTQTLTALAGSSALISFLGILPLYGFYQSYLNYEDTTLMLLSMIGLFIWNILVYTHILRHALEISFMIALAVTMVTLLLMTSVLQKLVATLN